MKIKFYNKKDSTISFQSEICSYHPSILIADTVLFDTVLAETIHRYLRLDLYKEEQILILAGAYFEGINENTEGIKEINQLIKEYKLRTKLKRKNKEDLIIFGRFKSLAKSLRELLKTVTKEELEQLNIWELLPFYDEKVFQIGGLNYSEDSTPENTYIKGMLYNYSCSDILLCVGREIEQHYSFSLLDATDTESDFIKIPLWNFPPFIGTTYAKLKHIRDDLKPILLPFKEKLNEINIHIQDIQYSKDTTATLKEYFTDNLLPLISPIQDKIENNLYVSQYRNTYSKENFITLNLCVTSADTITNYYEKVGILIPYVATEIKYNLEKFDCLKASYMFLYYEVNN